MRGMPFKEAFDPVGIYLGSWTLTFSSAPPMGGEEGGKEFIRIVESYFASHPHRGRGHIYKSSHDALLS